MDDLKVVLSQYLPSAAMQPVSMAEHSQGGLPDAIRFEVAMNDETQEVFVYGRSGEPGELHSVEIGGSKVTISYGAKRIDLPFSLHLNRFELERYPGSHSPSSYASEVTLVDEKNNIQEDRRIFMNNILNYKGYRFFQSSYDTDEKGTILSVNSDYWGTLITYLGYFLLALGMTLALILPNTRFRYLIRRTGELARQKKNLVVLLVLAGTTVMASEIHPPHPVNEKLAEQFGSLWVQDNGGRIKPVNTMNSELMRKLVKHNTFKGLSADQVILSMLVDPQYWQSVPMITVKHDELKRQLQLSDKKASFSQFFSPDGQYKIKQIVELANRKRPAIRNKLEQDAIKIDEQVNVLYMAQMGTFLRLFPQPEDEHLPWLTPNARLQGGEEGDSLFVRNIFGMLVNAVSENNEAEAEEYIKAIANYQAKYTPTILPGERQKKLELFYNKTGVFMMLSPVFFVLGFILLVFQFITLLNPRWPFTRVNRIGFLLVVIAFVAYSGGLILRASISGHAPWSNGYESMLYIGWATLLAGLLFGKRSPISLSVTALFSGIILMVAHLSWMNPEITNLVPVLKSYWLTIHVAIITGSYGFLGLGALLGFLNLVLTGIKNNKNKKALSITIDELTGVADMTMTIGLYLLTVGAFLGGIWANESWGRYWGWDPKETWSAVTILVYAFILHMRMIPGLKGRTWFNFTTLVGFACVIMTYLGVNYYLAGMHSYAKGDAAPFPDSALYTIVVVLVVSVYAFYNESQLEKLKEDDE
jgi:cytochrome c-type biogenesis protein CcsB